jgi:hypothetical protein
MSGVEHIQTGRDRSPVLSDAVKQKQLMRRQSIKAATEKV